jgi:hypothetical protein
MNGFNPIEGRLYTSQPHPPAPRDHLNHATAPKQAPDEAGVRRQHR